MQTPMSTYSHPSEDEIRNEWQKVEKRFEIKGGENKK